LFRQVRGVLHFKPSHTIKDCEQSVLHKIRPICLNNDGNELVKGALLWKSYEHTKQN